MLPLAFLVLTLPSLPDDRSVTGTCDLDTMTLSQARVLNGQSPSLSPPQAIPPGRPTTIALKSGRRESPTRNAGFQ